VGNESPTSHWRETHEPPGEPGFFVWPTIGTASRSARGGGRSANFGTTYKRGAQPRRWWTHVHTTLEGEEGMGHECVTFGEKHFNPALLGLNEFFPHSS